MKKIYALGLGVLLAGSLSAQNNGLSSSASNDVTSANGFAVTPGVEVFNNNEKVQVYSFNNEVYVNAEGFGAIDGQIEVYDLLGKQIVNLNFNTSNLILPINVQSSSLYIVNVTINGNSFSQKLYIK